MEDKNPETKKSQRKKVTLSDDFMSTQEIDTLINNWVESRKL